MKKYKKIKTSLGSEPATSTFDLSFSSEIAMNRSLSGLSKYVYVE